MSTLSRASNAPPAAKATAAHDRPGIYKRITNLVWEFSKSLPAGSIDPHSRTILIFATIVAVLITVTAFFTPRNGAIDEIGLYNPTYMYLHYGKMSYPIHGFFDKMVVHPPLHYAMVAWLMRFGLPLYYAEAAPAWSMSMLCILIIALSPMRNYLKLGMLFSLYFPAALFPIEMFGLRPEMHLGFAWIAGLVMLEWARLRAWDSRLLFAGSFLVTYASGLHYYAAFGCLAAAVYGAFLIHDRGWKGAGVQLASIVGGAMLFGIPYLLWFVIPDFKAIVGMLLNTQGSGGIREALRLHFEHYRYWDNYGLGGAALRLPFHYGIPVILISTPAFLLLPQARVLVTAALPLQMFILFFATHKHLYYFIHEVAIYAAALTVAALVLAEALLDAMRWKAAKSILLPFMTLLLTYNLTADNIILPKAVVSMRGLVHESEIARAAGKEMLGPNALVGGHLGLWYASGGATWYGIDPDVLWAKHLDFEPADYFRQFDAIAEGMHMSNATYNDRHATLSSWYADGTLKLRGFFFGEDNNDLNYVLLHPEGSQRLTGYALKNSQLYRFEERQNGNYATITATCPDGAATGNMRNQTYFSSVLYLPKTDAAAPQMLLVTAVLPGQSIDTLNSFAPDCRVLRRVPGILLFADRDALLTKLRTEDKTMRFLRALSTPAASSAKPAASGPPPEAVRRPDCISLDEVKLAYTQASIRSGRPVRVTTAPGMGSYAASFPIHAKDIPQCWITVQAKVLKGTVAFGAFNRAARDFVAQSPPLQTSGQPLRISLHLDSPARADDLMIRNADGQQPSQVEIYDVALWVLPHGTKAPNSSSAREARRQH